MPASHERQSVAVGPKAPPSRVIRWTKPDDRIRCPINDLKDLRLLLLPNGCRLSIAREIRRSSRQTLTARSRAVNASICSSDPLCIESQGQGTFSLNLAACHTCGLLPETSCEEGNLLLDRVMAIGTPNNTDIGYFSAVLNVRYPHLSGLSRPKGLFGSFQQNPITH
jgi:hypothetical protein